MLPTVSTLVNFFHREGVSQQAAVVMEQNQQGYRNQQQIPREGVVVIKRTGTLSLPLLFTCILSMACSSAQPTPPSISLPYVRHHRNIATPIVFEGRVVGVQDGDTITVLDSSNENHRIRLQGIDAPEKGQAFGSKSGQTLSQAVFDRVVTVERSKHDRYGRIVGKVLVHTENLIRRLNHCT
jgi:endonuclease YncB( thermonuclease family)